MKFIFGFIILILLVQLGSSLELIKKVELVNEIGNGASATLSLRETRLTSNKFMEVLNLKTKNLMPQNGMKYNFWLVDEESGYHLNIGQIKPSKKGRASFVYKTEDINIKLFDRVLITQENEFDIDPHPAQHILSGELSFDGLNKVKMKALLRGIFQIPKVTTPASGVGTFEMDRENNILTYDITIKNLKSEETSAHIHGFALKGVNGPVLFELPIGNHKQGFIVYNDSIEDELLAGMTYVNVHTINFPAGEIRGQIYAS
ncbi:MAG: CHRD domain-containing protein [Nanoarchaeota archaeon]|nr:CHRD domain-containing protein [Nanoarchaeota archaeon]